MLQKQCLLPGSLDLLHSLYRTPDLKEFYLVGGSALALQLGHRISVDFDLFTHAEFDPDSLLEKIIPLGNVHVIGKQKNTLNVLLNKIKVDFIRYNYPLIEPIATMEGIRLFSLKDIAAAKLSAITNRGTRKDFYDLAELLNHFTLNDMLDFFSIKFPDMEQFMVLKSLSWFDDAEDEPEIETLKEVSWTKVKEKVLDALKQRM